MGHAVPPTEARRARDNFLRALGPEALEELVYYEAAGRPSQAAAAVELPPLRLQASHGFAARRRRRRCENTAETLSARRCKLIRLDSLLGPELTE